VSSVAVTFLCVLVAEAFFRSGSTKAALSMLASMSGFHGLSFLPAAANDKLMPWTLIVLGYAIVWGLPNTQQILSRFKPALHLSVWDEGKIPASMLWTPTARWALALSAVLFFALVRLRDPSSFLYFQF
jgi:hypothetical protein